MLFRSQSSLPGYQIMLRRPLPASGDLQGFKIRGNPTYLSVINMLGASMVTLPVPEVFTSMEKGVIDGFAFPSFGVVSTRLNEVSKFMLRPAMGISTNPLLVNLAAWNRMPAAEQKIFLEESRKAEDRWTAEVDKLIVDEDLVALLDSGHLGGAALDVFREEPLPASHAFWRHPKVVVTPHVSAPTLAATAAPQIVENYRRALGGRPLLHPVDRDRRY